MAAGTIEPMRGVGTHGLEFAGKNEGSHSAVSWAAVAAGAFVATALGLILLALGAGAGLSSLSPWSTSGLTPSAVGIGAILWLTVAQIISCTAGGYIAGRLRTKWVDVHSHEVFFRDTAHGFLSWAVALVLTAGFLTSAASMMVGADTRGTAGARATSSSETADRYYIDHLYRAANSSPQAIVIADENLRVESGRILAHAVRDRQLSQSDQSYLAASVASRTGLTPEDADKRVTNVFGEVQGAVDRARKAAAHALYWLFVALLLGAFSASLAATLGGKQRDLAHLG